MKFKDFISIKKSKDVHQLLESSDLTYYELRRLLEIMLLIIKDPVTVRVLNSFIQALNYMEIRNVKVPPIKKRSKKSKRIF